jgi:protein SCO1/2
MASWFWIVPAFSALLFTGCAGHAGLPSYAVVPDFSLTDQTGAQFDSAEKLKNTIWIADFIFTTCGGPCPRMTSQMHQVQVATTGTGIKLVSFTVDPERDTPEVLAAYAGKFQADGRRWFFLTGPTPTLQHLSRDVFTLGNVDSKLEHSTRFVLIDRKSRVRGFYLTSEPDSIPHLVADAKDLLKERF